MGPVTEYEDLACKALVEMVTAYLEGAMSDHERARLEHHLTLCRGCVAYVERIKTIIRASREIDGPKISAPERERLLAAFRATR